jgi:hypothetical protein
MMQVPFKTRKDIIALSFLLFLSVVFFFPALFGGKTFYAFDILYQFFPWSSSSPNVPFNNPLIGDPVNLDFPFQLFVKTWIREGTFPLWNGSNFCGLPISAGGLARYVNPVTCLSYMLLPVTWAHDLILWFHLFGAGLFMYLYLREIELEICPSLIGAVSWMFNGYVMVWFEWEAIVILAFSLPATLLFFERWLKSGSVRHCLFFTLAVGFSVGSGFPHILIYQFFFIGFYILYRYFGAEERRPVLRDKRRIFFHLALSVVLGLLISAAFLVGHISLMGDLQRPAIAFAQLFRETGQLPLKYLITLLFPDFYGSPLYPACFIPGLQPYNNYNELCIYGGVPALFLAVACIPHLGRKPVGFYFLIALLTLTMAMGSILYYPLARFVPGLNMSTPTRILYLFGFSLSVLAGLGANQLIRGATRRQKRMNLGLWGLLSAFGVGIFLFVQTRSGIEWAFGDPRGGDWNGIHDLLKAHFDMFSVILTKPLLLTALSFYLFAGALLVKKERQRVLFLALGLVLLAFDLFSFGSSYNTTVSRTMAYPMTESVGFLKKDRSLYRIITYDRFLHNSFAPYGIEDLGGYAPFYGRRTGDYLHLSQYGPEVPPPEHYSRWTFFRSFGSPLLDLMNVKYILLPPHKGLETPKLELVYDGEIKIYRNRAALPRIFFVGEYDVFGSKEALYQAMGGYRAGDFLEKVLLEKEPPLEFRREKGTSGRHGKAEIDLISYRPNSIEIELSADASGFLVIGDKYHPDWRAKVDGSEREILQANYIMRAIPIEAGTHRIALTFRPEGLIAGAALSVLGWIMLVVMLAASFRQGGGGRQRREKS